MVAWPVVVLEETTQLVDITGIADSKIESVPISHSVRAGRAKTQLQDSILEPSPSRSVALPLSFYP